MQAGRTGPAVTSPPAKAATLHRLSGSGDGGRAVWPRQVSLTLEPTSQRAQHGQHRAGRLRLGARWLPHSYWGDISPHLIPKVDGVGIDGPPFVMLQTGRVLCSSQVWGFVCWGSLSASPTVLCWCHSGLCKMGLTRAGASSAAGGLQPVLAKHSSLLVCNRVCDLSQASA